MGWREAQAMEAPGLTDGELLDRVFGPGLCLKDWWADRVTGLFAVTPYAHEAVRRGFAHRPDHPLELEPTGAGARIIAAILKKPGGTEAPPADVGLA